MGAETLEPSRGDRVGRVVRPAQELPPVSPYEGQNPAHISSDDFSIVPPENRP
jgi:hypothetical protein